MLRKIFRERPSQPWTIIEKDLVDEIIFRTTKPRSRIMLELMARGGMRIGEVLKMRPLDIQGRKIILAAPKSGRESEVAFIPQKVSDRLKEYINESGAEADRRLFPMSYNAARMMVRKAGRLVGIALRPHDLRRHAATFASRSGTPIEIVSKVIMRHAHLSTTQRYLGKVTEGEAMRWIENRYMNTAGAECGISAPIHERLGSERYRIERCDLLVIMADIRFYVRRNYKQRDR